MSKPRRSLNFMVSIIFVTGMLFTLVGCADLPAPANNDSLNKERTATPRPQPTRTPIPTKAPSPDMRGETFTIYMIASNDEPFTQITESVRNGLEDYAAYLNAHGGVNGAEIKLMFAEVDVTGAGAAGAFKLFSERDDALVILILAPVNQELYEAINKQDLPVIYFGAGAVPLELTTENDHLFWLVPPPDQQLALWLDYAVDHWNEIRPAGQFNVMRLNYISWAGSLGGFDRLAGMRSYLQQESIILASEGRINPSANASASNPILNGVFTQATMIYLDLFAYGPALVLNDLYYLDLGRFFVTAGGSWTLGIHLEDYLPFPEQVEVIYTPIPFAWWTEDSNPGIIAAQEIFEFGDRVSSQRDLGYLFGLVAADLASTALKTALIEQKNAVRVKIDGEGVYKALSELDDYQVLGGLFTADFSDGSRTPQEIRIWKFVAGEGMFLESGYLPLPDLD